MTSTVSEFGKHMLRVNNEYTNFAVTFEQVQNLILIPTPSPLQNNNVKPHHFFTQNRKLIRLQEIFNIALIIH